MNVLVLSSGTRNKIIEYFKENTEGCVIAADCSEFAPSLYVADKHYVVPKIDDHQYLENIINICKENKIDVLFSLIDPELEILAANYELFQSIGATPIVSSLNTIEVTFDKNKFFEILQINNVPTILTFSNLEDFYEKYDKSEIDFPVFVKPKNGSASININKVNTKSELKYLFEKYDNLIIQEFIDGVEFGVDAYIDLISGELVSMFVKEKILMRSGETDKSISIINEDITKLVKQLVDTIPLKGMVDIDIFRKKDGSFIISEVNPRFGGGYPHAYESGINFPQLIQNNIKNIANQPMFNNYLQGIVMMKYNEIIIKR